MKRLTIFLTLFMLTGCTDSAFTLDLSQLTSGQTPTVTPAVQYPEWVTVQPGVEFKQVLVGEGLAAELIDLVHIDQTQAQLQVAVNETEPKTVSSWLDTLGASVVFNGSYFDEQYQILTRTIVAGEVEGKLLSGATGLAQQTGQGWSITPWAGETVTANNAIQSYPLLLNDGEPFTNGSADTAQRTVLAEADDGSLYIIIAEYGVLSLADLAAVLATELDLNLRFALNLDGGTSTGLGLNSSAITFIDDSLVVPSVLYILP